jgi:protein-disulfide isomerase
MSCFRRRARALLCASLFSACLYAQDWKTAGSLPGIDLNGLSQGQKATVLKILREHDCSCGCGMKLAECRIADPGCAYSTGLAATIISSIKSGKSADEAWAAAGASKWAHTQPADRLLDDAVAIPVSGAPSLGPEKAPITVVEFSDFQCPYCAAAVPEIKSMLKAYPTQVKLIFKQYPLEMHSQADLAAAAAIAAQKQSKFWEMHDAMYSHYQDLSRKSILALAKQIGLDIDRFETDIDSTEVRETVVRDVQDGNDAGVNGTPTLFVNGQRYNGPIVLSSLKPVVDDELQHPRAASPVAVTK